MYQNSLKYVKDLFKMAMQKAKTSDVLEERIQYLSDNITQTLYTNICRGLFESSKLIFSFLICTSIQRRAKSIPEEGWKYLLRGAGVMDKSEQPEFPQGAEDVISSLAWDLAYALE